MRHTTKLFSTVFVCSLFLPAITARSQVLVVNPPDFTISAGYSNLHTQRATNLFYTHDGGYIDGDVAWQLPQIPPLQLGIGVTGSGHFDRERINVPANGDFFFDDHLQSDIGIFEIEPRIGLHLGHDTGFFAIPRLGAGLLVSNYAIDQAFNSNGNTYVSTERHTGAAIEVRPSIQVGYSWGQISAGAEANYSYAWGNFGNLGRHAEEYRIGAFVRFSF